MMALLIAVFLFLLLSALFFGLYRLVFYHPPGKRPDIRQIPDSNLYRLHKDKMLKCIEDMEATPCEPVSILSPDGLRLSGRLYLLKKDAPLVLFFHGFHGTYAWDGYGFFRLCKKNGFNILLADERAHGKSEGDVITFGIMERYDCKSWAEYALKRFGKDTDIFLAGVSMGAASVMMAYELGLPENVRAVIEDCGYTEPAAIIKETIRSMKLPTGPVYQCVRAGAHLFGHFDLEEADALHAVRKFEIPILFIHGTRDSVVPPSMGEALYGACHAKKEWLLVEGADHANSAMTDYETYEKVILRFMKQNMKRDEPSEER